MKKRQSARRIKLAIFFIFGILSLIMILVSLLSDYNATSVKEIITQYYYASAFLYIGWIAIAAATTLPISAVLIAGIILFPFWKAVLYTFIGVLIGAIILFIFSRKVGRDSFIEYAELKGGRLKALNDLLQENSLNMILLLNFVYFLPSNLAHMVAGVTKIKFPEFFFITLIGNFPNTLAIALLVYGTLNTNNIFIILSLIILILTTAIPLYLYRKHIKDIIILAFNEKAYMRLKKIKKMIKRNK